MSIPPSYHKVLYTLAVRIVQYKVFQSNYKSPEKNYGTCLRNKVTIKVQHITQYNEFVIETDIHI
jgi:hypothetical protein